MKRLLICSFLALLLIGCAAMERGAEKTGEGIHKGAEASKPALEKTEKAIEHGAEKTGDWFKRMEDKISGDSED